MTNKSPWQLCVFVLFLLIPLFAENAKSLTADYWIIENPGMLVIYDRYEQRLTAGEKAYFPSFSAWRILEYNHTLSDQFTRAIKVEYEGKEYYFQKSSTDRVVNRVQAGKIMNLQNVQVLGDTVFVNNSGQLSMIIGNSEFPLPEGTLLERIFLYRGRTFANQISGQAAGWVNGNGQAHWEKFQQGVDDRIIEEQLFLHVDRIFQSYNSRLSKLFNYLNRQNDVQLKSPQWIAHKSPTFLRYTLEPAEYQKHFSGSQSYLIQELKDLLAGSIYELSGNAGQILIIKSSR